jgi:hypothetical protein
VNDTDLLRVKITRLEADNAQLQRLLTACLLQLGHPITLTAEYNGKTYQYELVIKEDYILHTVWLDVNEGHSY